MRVHQRDIRFVKPRKACYERDRRPERKSAFRGRQTDEQPRRRSGYDGNARSEGDEAPPYESETRLDVHERRRRGVEPVELVLLAAERSHERDAAAGEHVLEDLLNAVSLETRILAKRPSASRYAWQRSDDKG